MKKGKELGSIIALFIVEEREREREREREKKRENSS
jgi:hypothetical protein